MFNVSTVLLDDALLTLKMCCYRSRLCFQLLLRGHSTR